MKKNVKTTGPFTMMILSLLVLSLITAVSQGQLNEWGINEEIEYYLVVQAMNGAEGTDFGLTLGFDDTTVFGIGMGWSLSEHYNLNTAMLFGSTDLGTPGGGISGDTTLFFWDVNIDYYFQTERVTPMITGGIGFASFNGDFGSSFSEFSESNFSYNFGAGFRWDFEEGGFLKALYKTTWTQLKDFDDIEFDGFSISIILPF